MKPYTDLTTHQDAAYKLADMVNSQQYKNILVFEFHEIVDYADYDNSREGLEEFRNRSNNYYPIFLTGGLVDEEPANINIAIKIADEWFIVEDCGSNFYLGYGPTGMLKLREACFTNGVSIFHSEENFKNWVSKKFGSQKKQLLDTVFQEDKQFAKIIKALMFITVDMQRRRYVYQNLKEENIRDVLLPIFNGIFKGRSNGEAVNGAGKTDLLIRTKDGLNEHIIELKKWKGQKTLEEVIAQLGTYLSWHNNNAGIVLFCYNQDYSRILEIAYKYLDKNYETFPIVKDRENIMIFKMPYPNDRYKHITVYINFINLI